LGEVERGRELAQQARGYIPAPLPPLLRSWTKASLARFEILEGNLAQAEAYVRDGYVGLNLNDFYWTTPITICLAEAELALAHQDFDRARVVLDELLSRLAMARIRAYVPDALYLKSQTLLAQGLTQSEDVRAALTEARATAEALNSRRSLWLILATLSQIETEHGNHAAAQSLFQQARTLVTFIADQIDTPELRASFLSLPNVQAVLK